MATKKSKPSPPKPTAPGKPSSRQPPDSNTGKGQGRKEKDLDEGQDIPKTGHARSQ